MKDIIIGDINGDSSTELVISLTDRVVRTYKWVSSLSPPGEEAQCGRLVSVNKWEFASQIGTVTLNHDTDGSPALLGEQQTVPPGLPQEKIFQSPSQGEPS